MEYLFPTIKFVSNCTGKDLTPGEVTMARSKNPPIRKHIFMSFFAAAIINNKHLL